MHKTIWRWITMLLYYKYPYAPSQNWNLVHALKHEGRLVPNVRPHSGPLEVVDMVSQSAKQLVMRRPSGLALDDLRMTSQGALTIDRWNTCNTCDCPSLEDFCSGRNRKVNCMGWSVFPAHFEIVSYRLVPEGTVKRNNNFVAQRQNPVSNIAIQYAT